MPPGKVRLASWERPALGAWGSRQIWFCVKNIILWASGAHTPVYTGKAQAYRKRGFSVQHRSRRQTPQPPKGKQPPMSEVGRRPEQTPSFQRKVEQTDTQKHKGEHTSTAGLGWAGLGWVGQRAQPWPAGSSGALGGAHLPLASGSPTRGPSRGCSQVHP